MVVSNIRVEAWAKVDQKDGLRGLQPPTPPLEVHVFCYLFESS